MGPVTQVYDPGGRGSSPPIPLPGPEGIAKWRIGQGSTIRRIGSQVGPGNREFFWVPALHSDGEELALAIRVKPARGEQDLRPIRGPSLDVVPPRVEGQTPWAATVGRDDIDIRVPVVLTGEGDPPTIRGELRGGFRAYMCRQPAGVPPAGRCGP